MSDSLGRITIPTPATSTAPTLPLGTPIADGATGAQFPLVPDYGYGTSRPFSTITHRFGEAATYAYQTFSTGSGARRFSFIKRSLNLVKRNLLFNFFEATQGAQQIFTYAAPGSDGHTYTNYNVMFENTPLTTTDLATFATSGCTLVEIVSSPPTYTVASTVLRFPSSALATALLSQTQTIVPLVHIVPRDSSVPDNIYLSDRRCLVAGQLYLPRLLGVGDPGSDIIMSQDIQGSADNVQFQFANGDRVMTALSNDCDLKYASITLSLYHVQSSILLQLWAGIIVDYATDGSPTFSMRCTDGMYQITLPYPGRTISRQCWKYFADSSVPTLGTSNCPYATAGSGGNNTPGTGCSYFFSSPYISGDPNNPGGCLEHNMTPYHGGHPAQPQTVNIKDNSTGVLGFGRNLVAATSIVSDSMYGKALPDIWCNDDGNPVNAFYVNAIIAAARDEGDFFDLLGIVGRGPIGSYEGMTIASNSDGYQFVVAPTGDGFYSQGFEVNSNLTIHSDSTAGLREIVGTDPSTSAEEGNGSFSLGQGTPQVWSNSQAAGTAFVELRYKKPSGFTLTTADQHQMVVPIAQGLSGWTFDSGGARTTIPGLTNPAWIAVNTYLNALGLQTASAASQLSTFVLSSLTTSLGDGAADICITPVPSIIGGGSETQFRFQGTLGDQKPLRDWLREILNTCLGYYVFEYGKLKLGIRYNATPTDTFTLGNMLYQSLRLTPISAAYEHQIMDFADVEYQYQANIAEYQDRSHAAFYGRLNSPLTSRVHSVGAATLSQALRIVATQVREEIGGIDQNEWLAARLASWKTTILALNTEVGQVISITHPDVPGGTGNFRIIKWTLYKDWSIEIQGKTVTDSMYSLELGPPVIGATPPTLPILTYPVPQGEWAPFTVLGGNSDALFPGEYTFDLAQSYPLDASNNPIATLTATGALPVNTYLPGCGYPTINQGNLTPHLTGGTLLNGQTYRLSVAAFNSTGIGEPSPIIIVKNAVSGSNTNSFTLSGIEWPNFPGLTGYYIFYSTSDDLICWQQTGSLTGSPGSYSPTSITVTGPYARSTWSLPNSNISGVELLAKNLVHGGVVGAPITSVSLNTIVSSSTIDSLATDNWTGRKLYILGRNSAPTPFWAANITGFNATTGTFTLDRDPVAGGLLPADVFAVTFRGYDNSANPYSFIDSGLSNATNSHTGESPHDPNRIGNIVRVWAGTNRGSTAKIVDCSSTGYTLDAPLLIDSTSILLVEDGSWGYGPVLSSDVGNQVYSTQTKMNMGVDNLAKQAILVGGFTVDSTGNVASDVDAPVRPIWIFGGSNGALSTPQNVTLGTPSYRAAGPDAQGKQLVEIFVSYTPSGVTGDPADRVYVYLQAPDDIPTTNKAAIGTVSGFIVGAAGTASNIIQVTKPTPEGTFLFTNEHLIHFTAPAPAAAQVWRIYATSGSPAIENPLVRANLPSPTPSVTLTVNPPVPVISGAEYAPNPTGAVFC